MPSRSKGLSATVSIKWKGVGASRSPTLPTQITNLGRVWGYLRPLARRAIYPPTPLARGHTSNLQLLMPWNREKEGLPKNKNMAWVEQIASSRRRKASSLWQWCLPLRPAGKAFARLDFAQWHARVAPVLPPFCPARVALSGWPRQGCPPQLPLPGPARIAPAAFPTRVAPARAGLPHQGIVEICKMKGSFSDDLWVRPVVDSDGAVECVHGERNLGWLLFPSSFMHIPRWATEKLL